MAVARYCMIGASCHSEKDSFNADWLSYEQSENRLAERDPLLTMDCLRTAAGDM